MQALDNLEPHLERLLLSLEGGESHARERVDTSSSLSLSQYSAIGQILKASSKSPELHEELLDRISPHVDVITGVLPPGIQSHGLIPDLAEEADTESLRQRLKKITDAEIRQWIIDDCSLIYGELTKDELATYFFEILPLLNHSVTFIDLGSGLGKVVMTAALAATFENYLGIELLPYRHKLAASNFSRFCLNLEQIHGQLLGTSNHHASSKSPLFQPSLGHIKSLPSRISFLQQDMFDCDVGDASLIFIYSTCFGSLLPKLAQKLANEAPEGCLITTTTFSFTHPGLRLIKRYKPNSIAWTEIFVFERVGSGPWVDSPSEMQGITRNSDWKIKAKELLGF